MSFASRLIAALMLVALASTASAIVTAPVGRSNTTAPADDPGFSRITQATSGNTGGVYVGDGWVVTATHTGCLPMTFGGVEYAVVSGSCLDSAGGTDISVFRIAREAWMPPTGRMKVGHTLVPYDTTVTMFGTSNGMALSATNENWNNSGLWTYPGCPPLTSGCNNDGVTWSGSPAKRWGTATVFDNSYPQTNDTYSIMLRFDVAVDNSASGVAGDSGNGVFYKNPEGQWELAGTLWSVVPLGSTGVLLTNSLTIAAEAYAARAAIRQHRASGERVSFTPGVTITGGAIFNQ